MVKTIIEVHMYSDKPEDKVEGFVAKWVDEAGWHLPDGESFRLAKVERSTENAQEDPEGYWVILVDDENGKEARVNVGLDEWHPPLIETGLDEEWRWDGQFWRSNGNDAEPRDEGFGRWLTERYEMARDAYHGSTDYLERAAA